MDIIVAAVMVIVGFVLLVKGADWFVDGAAGIAARFGIPQLIIGLTIVAMGTSAPEAAVSITAAMKGNADISIGNVLGSNILNVLIILGITAVITPLAVQVSTIRYEIPFMIAVTVLLPALGLNDRNVGRVDGIILWAAFLLYLAYLFYMAKKGNGEEEEEEKEQPLYRQILGLVLGMALVVIGSDVTVDGATALAKIFGMSERFIGLTIVAFGTSLPELVTSITAAMKKKVDIAVGNIVGSNIFNILFVIGTTTLILPVPFTIDFLFDAVVAILTAIFLWLCIFRDHYLERKGGLTMLVAYAVYFGYLCM